jgi:hypothetical protein
MLDKKCSFCQKNFVVGDKYEKHGEDYSHTKCLDEQMFLYRHNPYTKLVLLRNQLNQLIIKNEGRVQL